MNYQSPRVNFHEDLNERSNSFEDEDIMKGIPDPENDPLLKSSPRKNNFIIPSR